MYFLINYDRGQGKLIELRQFDENQKSEGMRTRLDLELKANALGLDREIGVLDASSEEILRRTHSRYFMRLEQLIENFRQSMENPSGTII